MDEKIPQSLPSTALGSIEKCAINSLTDVIDAPIAMPDPTKVVFEGDNDPEDPLNWAKTYKWSVIALLSAMSLVTSLATVICTPAAPLILEDLHSSNVLYTTILVSIWELGEAVGLMVIGPLSEIYGRLPVYHIANTLFVVFSIAGAVSSNLDMLVAFRFLNGTTVASLTLNPAIVGDMFMAEERGGKMAIMSLAPLLGPVAGPVIGGYLAQSLGWRWTFWLPALLAATCEVLFILVVRETYKVKILERKARRLRKATGDESLRSVHDAGLSYGEALKRSAIRPARMLLFSPVILILSIYVAVVYGYLYLVMTTITEVFEDRYHIPSNSVGLTFLGLGIGMIAGVFLCRATLDWLLARGKRINGLAQPEHRLPVMVLGAIVNPVGLFLYGWSAQANLQWMAPISGTSLVGFGLMVTLIPSYSYVVDAFGIHGASAIGASTVLRCIFATILPLAGPPLYLQLGLGWGNSLLGFIAMAFIPFPLLLLIKGERIRKSSRFQVTF